MDTMILVMKNNSGRRGKSVGETRVMSLLDFYAYADREDCYIAYLAFPDAPPKRLTKGLIDREFPELKQSLYYECL